jgi:hypothetical protein
MKHTPCLLTNGYKSSMNCLFYIKRNVRYRIHNSLLLNPTLKYVRPGYTILQSNFCKICHGWFNSPQIFPFISASIESISVEHWWNLKTREARNIGRITCPSASSSTANPTWLHPGSKTIFHSDKQGIKLMFITYEYLFAISRITHCATIRKTKVLVVFRENQCCLWEFKGK